MSHQLTITSTTIATIDFETEGDARQWMDTWYLQDYQNLNWSDDEATVMELREGDKLLCVCYCEMNRNTPKVVQVMKQLLIDLPFYWGRFNVALKSWCFRMTLTDDDLQNKVLEDKLEVHSVYCDKHQWQNGDGTKNFWNAINEGHEDMTQEFFGTD